MNEAALIELLPVRISEPQNHSTMAMDTVPRNSLMG